MDVHFSAAQLESVYGAAFYDVLDVCQTHIRVMIDKDSKLNYFLI